MRKIAEWLYCKLSWLSKYIIIAFCGYKLTAYARNCSGSDLLVAIKSYTIVGLLLLSLLGIRHCIIEICSRLAPFTIDGDKLLSDYGLQSATYQEGEREILKLRPRGKLNHTVTLFVKANRSVPKISTDNQNFFDSLPSMDWNISTASIACADGSCYIFKLKQKEYYLTNDQTIDLFCYLMANRGKVKDAEEIDDEIDKYCTGLGPVRSPS